MIGIVIAVVLLGIIVSTPETRAAGKRAARPWGYAMAIPALALWIWMFSAIIPF
jgi:hypothetical protein